MQENKLVEMYIDYIEGNCLKQSSKDVEQVINRNNRNGYIPKSMVNTKSSLFVKKTEYSGILKSVNSKILNKIINDNFSFRMPQRLGEISVKKKKQSVYINKEGEVVNYLPVDWGATNKLWENDPVAKKNKKLIRHLNVHTNGFIVAFTYSKFTANFYNQSLYTFKPCRAAKLALYKAIKENKELDFFLKY